MMQHGVPPARRAARCKRALYIRRGHARWPCQLAMPGVRGGRHVRPRRLAPAPRGADAPRCAAARNLFAQVPTSPPPASPPAEGSCERVAPHVACCMLRVACGILHGCAASTRTCFSRTSRRSHAWRRCGAPHRRRARPAKRQSTEGAAIALPLWLYTPCAAASARLKGLTHTPPLPFPLPLPSPSRWRCAAV